MKPVIHQAVDEIQYCWAGPDIMLTFDRLHETDSGAVRGMLFIDSTAPSRNGGGGHIYWQQVSLTTASDRKTVTAKLDKVAPVQGGWEQDIDRCFMDVYKRHTAVPAPAALEAAEEAEVETSYLIDPVLPEGQVCLLLADQGSTKSYLMLYLATCVALGQRSVFGEPTHQGPVIFFDWEVDERTASRRLAWICNGLGSPVPTNLYYVNMSTRGRLFDRVRDMRYQIEKLGAVLAIVDSLTFATGADINSAEYAAPTMAAIGSLGEGVTKLASAHPTKASRNAGADEISVIGSGLYEFRARAIWHMRRESAVRTARFGVSMTPRKPFDGPPQRPLAYTMDFDNVNHSATFTTARLSDMPSLEKSTLPIAQQIRRALARGGRLDTNQLADLLMQKPEAIKLECNRMADVFPIVAGGGRGKPTVWALKAEADSVSDTE